MRSLGVQDGAGYRGSPGTGQVLTKEQRAGEEADRGGHSAIDSGARAGAHWGAADCHIGGELGTRGGVEAVWTIVLALINRFIYFF